MVITTRNYSWIVPEDVTVIVRVFKVLIHVRGAVLCIVPTIPRLVGNFVIEAYLKDVVIIGSVQVSIQVALFLLVCIVLVIYGRDPTLTSIISLSERKLIITHERAVWLAWDGLMAMLFVVWVRVTMRMLIVVFIIDFDVVLSNVYPLITLVL